MTDDNNCTVSVYHWSRQYSTFTTPLFTTITIYYDPEHSDVARPSLVQRAGKGVGEFYAKEVLNNRTENLEVFPLPFLKF